MHRRSGHGTRAGRTRSKSSSVVYHLAIRLRVECISFCDRSRRASQLWEASKSALGRHVDPNAGWSMQVHSAFNKWIESMVYVLTTAWTAVQLNADSQAVVEGRKSRMISVASHPVIGRTLVGTFLFWVCSAKDRCIMAAIPASLRVVRPFGHGRHKAAEWTACYHWQTAEPFLTTHLLASAHMLCREFSNLSPERYIRQPYLKQRSCKINSRSRIAIWPCGSTGGSCSQRSRACGSTFPSRLRFGRCLPAIDGAKSQL